MFYKASNLQNGGFCACWVGCSKGGGAGQTHGIVVEADRRSTIVSFVAQAGLLWLELQPCPAWNKAPGLASREHPLA